MSCPCTSTRQRSHRLQEALDFDLDAFRIAYPDGEPVGLANLAVRGQDAWIGGIGVIASARRAGVGETLMRALHDEARSRAVERVWLEVIDSNAGARALYDKLGYELTQDVEVWTLPAADGEPAGHEVPVPEVRARLPQRHEPWQRADGTLSRYDDLRGLVTDGGAMLFCVRTTAQLQQYAGDPSLCSRRSAHSGMSTCSTSLRTIRQRRSMVSSAARSSFASTRCSSSSSEH